MHTVDVVHAVATITLALVAVRFAQALAEHYAPNAEGTAVARYIYGGP